MKCNYFVILGEDLIYTESRQGTYCMYTVEEELCRLQCETYNQQCVCRLQVPTVLLRNLERVRNGNWTLGNSDG